MGSQFQDKFYKMNKTKLTLGIAVLLIAAGIIFTLLQHETHELLTFGANIPHFLHFVIGFIIIGTGLACIGYSIKQGTFRFPIDKIKDNLKKPVPLLIILLLIAGFVTLKYAAKDVRAETDFDKMKEAAKYCTNPSDTDPKCAQSFEQLRKDSEHMQAQKSAQEKIGIVRSEEHTSEL